MASDPLDYTDPRAVARAFARRGCGCGSSTPPRAQGLAQKLDDFTTIRSAENYRLAAMRLKSSAAQLDPLAAQDPAWLVLKGEVDAVATRFEGASNIPFVGPGLNDTAWHQLEELQRQVYDWAERLRKQGKDVPVQAPPPEKPLADSIGETVKAFTGAGGQTLGDRFAPTFSTGTKVFLGLLAGGLVLSQARPILERVLPARRPAEPEAESTRERTKAAS